MSFQQVLLTSQRETQCSATAEHKAIKQVCQVLWSDFVYVC